MTDDRAVHLLLSDLTILEDWSDELRAMFQQGLVGVYLVGSALARPTEANNESDDE